MRSACCMGTHTHTRPMSKKWFAVWRDRSQTWTASLPSRIRCIAREAGITKPSDAGALEGVMETACGCCSFTYMHNITNCINMKQSDICKPGKLGWSTVLLRQSCRPCAHQACETCQPNQSKKHVNPTHTSPAQLEVRCFGWRQVRLWHVLVQTPCPLALQECLRAA
jgi:hypothetical protein